MMHNKKAQKGQAFTLHTSSNEHLCSHFIRGIL